jgi:drug/metabolite transporter (DMT)-like permease
MTTAAVLLVLGSALLHASWNLVVKRSADRLVAAAAQMTFGAFVSLPLLAARGLPPGAWHFLAATSVVHLGYVLTLVRAYDRGDLSVVYPVARGTAPVIVTAGAALLLDDAPSGWGVAAVVLITLGILTLGVRGRPRGVGWALATSGFIAAYTMIDGAAVRALDDSVAYTLAAFVGIAVVLVPYTLWRRGVPRVAASLAAEWPSHLLAGSASVVAYALVLAAARVSPLGLVSALRETSVLFGALGGALLLKEGSAAARVRAAALIAAGMALLVAAG